MEGGVRLRGVWPIANLDDLCYKVTAKHPNAVISWWLMASYMYYDRDEPFLSDACYDSLGRKIATNWKVLTHQHKYLIPEPDGSIVHGFGIHFPSMVIGGACALVRDHLPERDKDVLSVSDRAQHPQAGEDSPHLGADQVPEDDPRRGHDLSSLLEECLVESSGPCLEDDRGGQV